MYVLVGLWLLAQLGLWGWGLSVGPVCDVEMWIWSWFGWERTLWFVNADPVLYCFHLNHLGLLMAQLVVIYKKEKFGWWVLGLGGLNLALYVGEVITAIRGIEIGAGF